MVGEVENDEREIDPSSSSAAMGLRPAQISDVRGLRWFVRRLREQGIRTTQEQRALS